jgi:hypothetical protein
MTSEHLISLIRVNCNNLDDLKKIANAIEAQIEAVELEESLKEIKQEKQPETLKQMQARKITRTTNVAGTCLRGYVHTSFNKLVETFGSPCLNDPPSEYSKITTEWMLCFPCGTVATIYNWKNYGYDPAPDEDYCWHIGGHTADAKALVMDELGLLPA